jgi:hypothetical protein
MEDAMPPETDEAQPVERSEPESSSGPEDAGQFTLEEWIEATQSCCGIHRESSSQEAEQG